MPNTYSVFGCKTNYRGQATATIFKLPKTPRELRDKLFRALHKDDLANNTSEENIFICIHHFRDEDIIRVDRALQADGTYTEIPRIRPIYRPNAVPVIFQGCPSHFTSIAPTSKRFRLESREEEYFAKGPRDSIIQDQQDSLRYALEDFEDLKSKLPGLHLGPDGVMSFLQSNTQLVPRESSIYCLILYT